MALIDRIKFDGLRSRDWLIYKFPRENLSWGAQLIVGEGQAAIFVKHGQICDTFFSGTYTLTTENLPLLRPFISLPFGGQTPFAAELYYINLTTRLDIPWGTSDPIQIFDPVYHVKLRIRAFGQFGLKIEDIHHFFKILIGSMNPADIVQYSKIQSLYKGIMLTKIKSTIADVIIRQKISALELSAHLEEISAHIHEELQDKVAEFGFHLVNFYIQSINFPEEDFAQINQLLQDKAAFEIMGYQHYAAKRAFDIYETAAGNENGVSGLFASSGIGAGIGLSMGSAVPAMPTQRQNKYCPVCGGENTPSARFCSQCGASLEELKCSCGAVLSPKMTFCPNCGQKNIHKNQNTQTERTE